MTWERFRSGHNRLSKWAPKEMADTCRSRLLLFQPVFAPMGQTPCKLRAQWASVSDGSNCLVFIPRHQQVSARNAVFWCLGKCPWSFYFTHYVCSICCSYLYIAFISWTISTNSCRLTIDDWIFLKKIWCPRLQPPGQLCSLLRICTPGRRRRTSCAERQLQQPLCCDATQACASPRPIRRASSLRTNRQYVPDVFRTTTVVCLCCERHRCCTLGPQIIWINTTLWK